MSFWHCPFTFHSYRCQIWFISCWLVLYMLCCLQVQCHSYTGYCWCVTPNGRPISGSAVANKKPRCQGGYNPINLSSNEQLSIITHVCTLCLQSSALVKDSCVMSPTFRMTDLYQNVVSVILWSNDDKSNSCMTFHVCGGCNLQPCGTVVSDWTDGHREGHPRTVRCLRHGAAV